MKTQVIAFIFLFSFLPTQAQSQSQCKEDYAGTNTGLGCEVSANGNGRIFLEDDEGNSKTVKMGKAKRILAREKRQIQRQRDQVRRLLKQTNSEPWQDSASSSKHFDAMVLLSQSFSVPEAQITEEDTIGEARSELITIRSLVKQAIKDNKKTRRSLKSCKRSECDCESKAIQAQFEFFHANNPDAQNNCAALGFIQWSAEETEGVDSVTAQYLFIGSGGPLPKSKTGTPPYDDTYRFYNSERVVPEGLHQLLFTQNSGSHSNPNVVVDCSESSAKQKASYANPILLFEACLPKKKKN